MARLLGLWVPQDVQTSFEVTLPPMAHYWKARRSPERCVRSSPCATHPFHNHQGPASPRRKLPERIPRLASLGSTARPRTTARSHLNHTRSLRLLLCINCHDLPGLPGVLLKATRSTRLHGFWPQNTERRRRPLTRPRSPGLRRRCGRLIPGNLGAALTACLKLLELLRRAVARSASLTPESSRTRRLDCSSRSLSEDARRNGVTQPHLSRRSPTTSLSPCLTRRTLG